MAYLPLDRFYEPVSRAATVVEVNAGTAEPISKARRGYLPLPLTTAQRMESASMAGARVAVITGFSHETHGA